MFDEIFERTSKLSEKFGKIYEYFPVQELASDFDRMMSDEELIDTNPLKKPLAKFNRVYKELIHSAKQALNSIERWSRSKGIEKDMDMPYQEEIVKWIYPMWDEGFVWNDLARGDSSPLVDALESLILYAKSLEEK